MWLALPIVILAILAVAGGLVVGGIYAIVLVPIAVILVVAALIASMWKRSTESRRIPSERGSPDLPHTPGQNVHAAPSTPDDIVNARRGAQ